MKTEIRWPSKVLSDDPPLRVGTNTGSCERKALKKLIKAVSYSKNGDLGEEMRDSLMLSRSRGNQAAFPRLRLCFAPRPKPIFLAKAERCAA